MTQEQFNLEYGEILEIDRWLTDTDQTKTLKEVHDCYKDNPDGTLPVEESERAEAFAVFLQEGLKALLEQDKEFMTD